jgi:hypothetical protein
MRREDQALARRVARGTHCGAISFDLSPLRAGLFLDGRIANLQPNRAGHLIGRRAWGDKCVEGSSPGEVVGLEPDTQGQAGSALRGIRWPLSLSIASGASALNWGAAAGREAAHSSGVTLETCEYDLAPGLPAFEESVGAFQVHCVDRTEVLRNRRAQRTRVHQPGDFVE